MQDISIIIPVYNASPHLHRCLDSIINQSHSSLDIILVNDGSSDASADICNSYAQADSRISVIHQSNNGAVAARNTALELVKGKYIAFVDADDWIHHKYCKNLWQAAEQAEADIAFSDVRKVEHTQTSPPYPYTAQARTGLADKLELLKELFYPAPWGKIYRAKLIQERKIRFLAEDGYCGFAEDILFALHCAHAANTIVFAPEAPYYYNRDNESSLCALPSRQASNNNDRRIIIHHMLKFALSNNFTANELAPILLAAENHLRWGGKSTLQGFMEDLASSDYPPAITSHFYRFATNYDSQRTYLQGCKEALKEGLREFPRLSAALHGLYRQIHFRK